MWLTSETHTYDQEQINLKTMNQATQKYVRNIYTLCGLCVLCLIVIHVILWT